MIVPNVGRLNLYLGGSNGLTISSSVIIPPELADYPHWEEDHFGYAVGAAGDVNGDGYADLLVGSPGYQYGRGKAYLYLWDGADWVEEKKFTAGDVNRADRFGLSVDVYASMDTGMLELRTVVLEPRTVRQPMQ